MEPGAICGEIAFYFRLKPKQGLALFCEHHDLARPAYSVVEKDSVYHATVDIGGVQTACESRESMDNAVHRAAHDLLRFFQLCHCDGTPWPSAMGMGMGIFDAFVASSRQCNLVNFQLTGFGERVNQKSSKTKLLSRVHQIVEENSVAEVSTYLPFLCTEIGCVAESNTFKGEVLKSQKMDTSRNKKLFHCLIRISRLGDGLCFYGTGKTVLAAKHGASLKVLKTLSFLSRSRMTR